MILSELKDLHTYKALSPNLAAAIEYLESIVIADQPDGRQAVIGEDVYTIVSSYQTRAVEAGKYETHQRYLDIQILISGEEFNLYEAADRLTPDGDYQADTDKLNYLHAPGSQKLLLHPGMALIYFPEDAHKACCMVGDAPLPVRKLLVKVKI